MNNILSQFQPADGSARQKSQLDLSSAAYAREISVKARQRTSSDLVIETREGDLVTLSTSSFSQMDAYSYTSEGIARTESGAALYSLKEREITLASGQSFSFSVEGDLSESELADIEALLTGLDSVMTEMKQGDMADAMTKALEIGVFETMSSYSADLSFSASYEVRSSSAAMAEYQAAGDRNLPELGLKTSPVAGNGPVRDDTPRFQLDRFFDKLVKQLHAHDNQLLQKARVPIDQIFKHHLEDLGSDKSRMESLFDYIDEAREKINSLIEKTVA